MLLGRLRMQGKLALVMLIPLVGVIALTIPVVVDRMELARAASATAERVTVAGRVGAVVQAIQQERLLSVGFSHDLVPPSELVLQTARVTDWSADLTRDGSAELPPEVADAVARVSDLTAIRGAVLAGRANAEQIGREFSAVIDRFIDALRLSSVADGATPEGRHVLALDATLRVDEEVSTGAYLLLDLAVTKSLVGMTRAAAQIAALDLLTKQFQSFATEEQVRAYDLVSSAFTAAAGPDFLAEFAANPVASTQSLNAPVLLPFIQSIIVNGRFVENKIIKDVQELVAERERSANATAYGVLGLSLLLVIAVMLIAFTVARTVTRPLLRLTQSAERVARLTETELVRVADDETETSSPVRLDPVDVRGRDEIGDLARAFERVQQTAARLVERQVASRRNVAQMFGHIGRRTENLVGRQLALIDRLERDESNSERLQSLYRLDHMASRLRRNASSLVALSGSAGTEQHSAPLALAHVVRLGLAEIEGYTRVDVEVPGTVQVVPSVIADLILIVAELMENATTFSPPHTRVTVSARPSDNGARLIITDRGLGLTEERLAEENARLARRERLDLAPTEVLGLFVVGRLARRHGMRVILSATPGGGVTATVYLSWRQLVLPEAEPLARGQAFTIAPANQLVRANGSSAGVGAQGKPAIEVAALDRASRSLESGLSWNAFAVSLDGPTAIGAGVTDTEPVVIEAEVTFPGQPADPQAPRSESRPRIKPVIEFRSAEPTAVPRPRLALDSPTSPPVLAEPSNRASSNAEAISRAEQQPVAAGQARVQSPGSGAEVVDHPAAEVIRAGADMAHTAEITDVAAMLGRSSLTRRVPGATLGDEAPPSRTSRLGKAPKEDPDRVRELMEEFELGVARGLRDAGTDNRPDGGTTR